MLSFFTNRKIIKQASENLFIKMNEYARNPDFYGENQVFDDPDGRFEMVALFSTAIFAAYDNSDDFQKEVSQALFDKIFKTFDQALRELGVGDMQVGKRIRKMAESFYGRQKSYYDLVKTQDKEALANKIALNVFSRDEEIEEIDLILAEKTIELFENIKIH